MNKTRPILILIIGMVLGGILCIALGLVVWGATTFFKSANTLPTLTPFPTATPTRQPTPRPKPTQKPTSVPIVGIGTPVRCGNSWTVEVLEPPEFRKEINASYTPYKAVGTYMILKIELTNNTNETQLLDSGLFSVEGVLNGKETEFQLDTNASYDLSSQILGFPRPLFLPPGLSLLMGLAFDVNTNASNWHLILQKLHSCEVSISLEP